MAQDEPSLISEVMEEALAAIVSEVRQQWLQELEILRAERRALVADLRLVAAGMAPSTPDPAPASPAKPATPVKASKPKVRA